MKSRFYPVLFMAWLLIAADSLQAENADSATRPRIGLVLGGGGAKGAAHIGVLQVLEEMHIPIDCVAGTSMGALVGATFAAGVSPEVIESQVLSVDWATTVGTAGDRDRMPIHRKLDSPPYTNNLDLGYQGGRLRGPGGFLNTQDIDDLLRTLVAGARNVQDFDALPIPFRAVATDMVSGTMVVLRDGDLSVAMRASMAVPGAFTPVVRDGQVLADGGQMRNLPVDIARELCGDVIIAVSLESPPPTVEDLSSSLAVAARSLDVMIDANSRAQLATLTDRDVSIVVPMGDIGSGSFERVPDAIPLGRAAALAQSAGLARYAVTPEEYHAWRAGVSRDYREPQRVATVDVVGLERVNPEYVQNAIVATKADAEVTPAAIAADAERIYALGDFQQVGYQVADSAGGSTVDFFPIEKSWGPDFVDLDLGFGWGNDGDVALLLRGEHRRTWITSLGGEWRNVVQIGTDAELKTGLYLPLEVRQRYFVEPFLRYTRYFEDIYDDGNRVAEYDFEERYGQVDLGVNLGNRAQLRAGLRQSWNQASLQTGARDLLPEEGDTRESDLVFQAKYDTRDSVGLPDRGTLLAARYLSSGSWLGGDESYGMAESLALVVLPFRGDAINLFAGGGIDASGELPGYRRYRIGGILSFPGLQRQQIRGDNYWLVGTNYNWRLADIQQLFNHALYAGLRLTSGHVGGRIDETHEDLLTGLAVTLSGRTPIGPFLLSLGGVDDNSWALQLAIGRPVREGSIFDEIW